MAIPWTCSSWSPTVHRKSINTFQTSSHCHVRMQFKFQRLIHLHVALLSIKYDFRLISYTMNCTITPKRTHFSVKRKIEDVLEFPFRQQKDSTIVPWFASRYFNISLPSLATSRSIWSNANKKATFLLSFFGFSTTPHLRLGSARSAFQSGGSQRLFSCLQSLILRNGGRISASRRI